jgi:hypothetical protein
MFMAILWLAAMGAIAALRASFVYNVDLAGCWNDGSAVNSNHCVSWKRHLLGKRETAAADQAALAEMAGMAAVAAFNM